jgi:integrase
MATVYKRGKVWYSRISIEGKDVRVPLSTDFREAEKKLADLVTQRAADRFGHGNMAIRWEEYKRRFLERSKRENKSNTYRADARAFAEFDRAVTVVKIGDITPQTLETVRSEWIDRGRGMYVINRDLRTLKSAFRKAEALGYMPKHDWQVVKYLKTPKGRLHFFTLEDLGRLKRVCKGPFLTLLYLGARAGLRRSECAHLEWSDVDFDRRRINVAPKDGWAPKDNDRRFIPMPPDLVEYLKKLLATASGKRVLSANGEVPAIDSLTTYFRRLVRKAGLKGSVHTLRHTYASHYVQNGGDIYKLSKYLGHSSIETSQIYAHLAKDTADTSIEDLPPIP